MAYSMMAEGPKGLDWAELLRAVKPIRRRVELFPIPGGGEGPDGLGLSIAQKNANDLGWEEFTQLADIFEKRFGMAVYDLKSGARYAPATTESIKRSFVGEDRPEE